MVRRLLPAVLIALLTTLLVAAPAVGQDGDSGSGETTSSTVPVVDEPDVDFLPQPNSGRPPEDIGDRGGAAQLAIFGVVLLGIAIVIALALRDMRRARARNEQRAGQPSASQPSTPSRKPVR